MFGKHEGVFFDFLVATVASCLDENQKWNARLEKTIRHMIDDGFSQLPTQISGLSAHVIYSSLQAFRLLLNTHLLGNNLFV